MNPHPPPTTVLRLEGADVLELLHRVTTQKLDDLAPGEARATLWCDHRGRLRHRAAVAHATDGSVWLLRDDAPGDSLAAAVERTVFREDVRIEDLGALRAVRAVGSDGRTAPGAVGERGGEVASVALPSGWTLEVAPVAAAEPPDERARIAAARPRHGHEIRDAFTPFEVGVAHEVHLAKGCFPGQEVLQRLVTYRSVRRRLARVAGEGPPPAVPEPLVSGERAAGVLTSAAASDDGWVGLAVVAIAQLETGAGVTLASGAPVSLEPVPITRPSGRP